MENTIDMTPQQAKWLAAANNKALRAARLAELKSNIRNLEAEYRKVNEMAPEAQMLVDQWTGSVQASKEQFIYELTARAAQGKIPLINFDSLGALAFLNADRWISAFPDLAEKVSGQKAISSTARALQVQIINDELIVLRSEYSALGGI